MTVIAWDGKTMAADKRTTDCGLPRTSTKIIRAEGGALLGACGDSSMCRALRAWWMAGADTENYPDKDKTSSLLVVTRGAKVLLYWDGPFPVETEEKFTAVGSGRDYAIAAMHFGQTAEDAVRLACIYDTGCGNGVDVLTLE
jgi:hypothetical protein